MDVNTIMNLQYRKLLTARELVWEQIGADWDEAGDAALPLAAAMSRFLIDLDSLSYPEIGPEEQSFLDQLIVPLQQNGAGVLIGLTEQQRQDLSWLAERFRLDDERHKIVALCFADFANETFPTLFIGKQMLEQIL